MTGDISRRGLLGFIAMSPIIVRAASIMPIRIPWWEALPPEPTPQELLVVQMITSEAVRLWNNSLQYEGPIQ